MRPSEWLRSAGAQSDVVDGLARFENWAALWSDCPRGDWMLAIAERLGAPHAALVGAAIACARIVDAGEEGARVLELAERWISGAVSTDEVAAAARELENAMQKAADPAAEAAARAALAVGLGVADRDVLGSAAAAAAESVIVSSMDCGLELALRWAHDKCASAVRAAIPWETLAPCIPASAGPG